MRFFDFPLTHVASHVAEDAFGTILVVEENICTLFDCDLRTCFFKYIYRL